MWTRAELKARGMAAFKANYWMCVLGAFLLTIGSGSGGGSGYRSGSNQNISEMFSNGDAMSSDIVAAIIAIVIAMLAVIVIAIVAGFALKAFVFNPLEIGVRRFFILNRENPKTEWREFGYGFKNNYMNIVKIMFFKDLYQFLWGLLFVIPGIVKGYEYLMIPYLLAEDSTLTKEEAFARTKQMMTGQKMDAFVLHLSFIGWIILTIFTCGILAIFYVNPYMEATEAELYAVLNGGASGDTTYYADGTTAAGTTTYYAE